LADLLRAVSSVSNRPFESAGMQIDKLRHCRSRAGRGVAASGRTLPKTGLLWSHYALGIGLHRIRWGTKLDIITCSPAQSKAW
jgi:hypothetical protein